ncbi:MAG: PASTA domain-containing protein [Acidobacteriota bacterium]
MRKRLLRLLGLLGYLGVLGGILVLSSYLAFSTFVRRGSMAVPDLVGLPVAAAEQVLAEKGLRLRQLQDEARFDETVPAGSVLQHNPPAGSFAKQGAAVGVILSRGQQLVEVPDLTGQAVQAAQVELAAAGLSLGSRASVVSLAGAPGAVVHQTPSAGELVDQATAVDLKVSTDNPAEIYVMPDLVYRDSEAVRRYFETRGFQLGSIKYEPYEGVDGGIVLRQYPLAGHPLRKRDTIALVVAAASTP